MTNQYLFILSAVALFATIALSTPQAMAAPLQYNYIEGRYVDVEVDDVDGDGFLIGGSYAIDSAFYVRADYQDVDFDGNRDADVIEIGVGYRYPYQKMHLIGEINYVDVDGDNIESDDGFLLTAGVRTPISSLLEGRASVNYVTVGDNDTYVELGADYFLTKKLSLGASVRLAAETDELSFGVRWYY